MFFPSKFRWGGDKSYLISRFRGDATLSPDHRLLAVSNLATGFDIYDLQTRERVKTYGCERNVRAKRTCLPVKFIHGGDLLLGGSSFGHAPVFHLSSEQAISNIVHKGMSSNHILTAHVNISPERPVVISLAVGSLKF